MATLIIPLVRNGAGNVLPSFSTIRLVNEEFEPALGFVGDTPVTEYENLPLDVADAEVEVERQTDISTEAGTPTFYAVTIRRAGQSLTETWYVQIPETGDNFQLAQLIGGAPVAPGDLISWRLLTEDERDALNAANPQPNAGNAIATVASMSASIADHVAEPDPHPQYLTETAADLAYATAAQGALADSAVQPGDSVLSLGAGTGIDGQFLRAGPAGSLYWHTVPSIVTTIFGRTGEVIAEAGDYNLDQIDETATCKHFTNVEMGKLAGIEEGATADQTGAEIKVAYEGEADTNAFTDAEMGKLAGVEDGATGDMTGAEIKVAYEAELDTNAYDDAAVNKMDGIETNATRDQNGAEIKVAYEAEPDTNEFDDTEKAKLAGMENNATRDQSGSEIKSLYEAEPNTNVYTDLEKSKLAGVEAGATADQTGVEIKFLYESQGNTNAYTDTEKSKLAGMESGATADQDGAEIKALYEAELDTNCFDDAEQAKLAGIEDGATADQTGEEIGDLLDASLGHVNWRRTVGTTGGTFCDGGDPRLLTSVQKTDLIGGTSITRHYHNTDRQRANHIGTQLLDTISNAGTAAEKDVGTGLNQIPLLEDVGGGVPGLPAVDGSQLTGVGVGVAEVTSIVGATGF